MHSVLYRTFVNSNGNYKNMLTSETEAELRNVLVTYVAMCVQPWNTLVRIIYDTAVFRTSNLPNTRLQHHGLVLRGLNMVQYVTAETEIN